MATDAQESGLDKVRAELICSICLDLLNEPKKLSCDHSFCQTCLEIHIQKSPSQSPVPPDPEDPQNDLQPKVIVCPCCRQETNLPDDGVEGLKTNFKLKSLVDILSTQERETTVQALGKGHYQRVNQAIPKCKDHAGEHCVFFCQDCKTLFCRFCIPDHKERRHTWDNYDSILSTHKEKLRGAIQPAYEAAQSAHDAMQELEKDKEAVVHNQDSVKGKVREYFSQLAAELENREAALMTMTDRYAQAKLEQLQKHYNELQKGHTSLLQNIQIIETQMKEDSLELLTDKESIEAKMLTHRDTICKALPKTEDVDTFIEVTLESQIPVATLGHLVFCQRNPCTGLVSTVRNFVETTDMAHIHLDLARPSAGSIEVPEYMQFRYAKLPPSDEDAYEELHSAAAVSHRKTSVPLPPIPFEQFQTPEEALYSDVASSANKTNRKRGESACSEEDPYDTIPANRHLTLPFSQAKGDKAKSNTLPTGHSTLRDKPDHLHPLSVIDLRNDDVRVSAITCTNAFFNLVITDTKNKCLRILNEGKILHTINPPDVAFSKPVALAKNSTNDIFVLDQGTRMFHKFRLNGDCLFSHPTKARKGPEKPWDIAISPDNAIYISDWSRKRVYVYDGLNGKKIRSIKGCYKRERKDEFLQFSRPAGICFDLGGRLMIADRGERCVWCINTEGDEFIKKIGEDHLHNPYGVAVAKDGKIIVTESESDCVSVFDEDGVLLHYFGGTGRDEGFLSSPHHVFVDDDMKIFVADTQNKRVQIFKMPEEPVYQNLTST